MRVNISRVLFLVATLTLLPVSAALACGNVFDVACNLSHGGLSPGNLNRQGQIIIDQARRPFDQAALEAAGDALQAYIIASHNTAINGSMPIPPDMRARLTGYASENSMNIARYKVGDNGFLNLAHAIEQGGFASAVTLIDVIVFRGPSEASDPTIWAHELTHVDQYAEYGVHSFAVQYARDHNSIERPAYAKGDSYWAWAEQQPQQQQLLQQQQQQMLQQQQTQLQQQQMQMQQANGGQMPQQPFGNVCRGQFALCGTANFAPLGSPCGCVNPNGSVAPGNIYPN